MPWVPQPKFRRAPQVEVKRARPRVSSALYKAFTAGRPRRLHKVPTVLPTSGRSFLRKFPWGAPFAGPSPIQVLNTNEGLGSTTLPTITSGNYVVAVVYAPQSPYGVSSISVSPVMDGDWTVIGAVNSSTGSPGALEFWAYTGYSDSAVPVTFTPQMAGSAGSALSISVLEVTDGSDTPLFATRFSFNTGIAGSTPVMPTLQLRVINELVVSAALAYTGSFGISSASGYHTLNNPYFFGYGYFPTTIFAAPSLTTSAAWITASIALYSENNQPQAVAKSTSSVLRFTVQTSANISVGLAKSSSRANSFTVTAVQSQAVHITTGLAKSTGRTRLYTVVVGTGVKIRPGLAKSTSKTLASVLSRGVNLSTGVAKAQGTVLSYRNLFGGSFTAGLAKVRGLVPKFSKSEIVSPRLATSTVRVPRFTISRGVNITVGLAKSTGRTRPYAFSTVQSKSVNITAKLAKSTSKRVGFTVTPGFGVTLHPALAKSTSNVRAWSKSLGAVITPRRAASSSKVLLSTLSRGTNIHPSPAKARGQVLPYSNARTNPTPVIRSTSSVLSFTFVTETGLAANVLTAAPYNDGVTTTYPEYSAVGTTGYAAKDPTQQLEGGGS